MVKFEIIETDGITYSLKNIATNEVVSLMLQFFDLTYEIAAGDTFICPEIMIDKNSEAFALLLSFREINKTDGNTPKDEIAGLIHNDHKIVLRRLFG